MATQKQRQAARLKRLPGRTRTALGKEANNSGADPEGAMAVYAHEVLPKLAHIPVSNAHFDEWRRSLSAFERLALLWGFSPNLTGLGEPER